jgi:hypothetical protein
VLTKIFVSGIGFGGFGGGFGHQAGSEKSAAIETIVSSVFGSCGAVEVR